MNSGYNVVSFKPKVKVLKLDSNHSSYRHTWAHAQEDPPPCNQHHYLSISPELAYNLFLSILFGVVALSTVRFKFLWTPHMCVLAAACASHHQVWGELQKRLGVQGKVSVSLHTVMPIVYRGKSKSCLQNSGLNHNA